MSNEKFQKDYREWIKSRDEYRTLIKAIAASKSKPGERVSEELTELANAAGVRITQVCELITLHRRAAAETTRLRAEKFQQVSEEMEVLNAKIREAERARATSTSLQQQAEAENELYELIEERQKLQNALADASVAAQCIAAAREAGLV